MLKVLEKRGLIWLACVVAISLAILALTMEPPVLGGDDSNDYLTAAYNLRHFGVFSEALGAPPTPGLGREPGYGAILSVLMALDPNGFGQFDAHCLPAPGGCSPHLAFLPRLANLVFVELAVLCVFLALFMLSGRKWIALIGAAYLAFNEQALGSRSYAYSDCLALFLAAATIAAGIWACRRRDALSFAVAGASLTALALTKSVFLIFAALAVPVLVLLCVLRRDAASLRAALIVGIVVLAGIGGWTARNAALVRQGQADERAGVALSTREALLHMTPTEYAASFLYWTRGSGDGWARDLFGEQAIHRLDLASPDGFYIKGQFSYVPRVEEKLRQGSTTLEATRAVNAELIQSILHNFPAYIATMAPVFYRGLWGDEFIVFGFPALLWAMSRAFARRDWILLAALSVGAFNLLIYPALSLNIPRYQITATPSLAIAFALAAMHLLQRKRPATEANARAELSAP